MEVKGGESVNEMAVDERVVESVVEVAVVTEVAR